LSNRRVMKNDEEIVKLAEDNDNGVETATANHKQQPITDRLCLAKCFFGVLLCYIVYAICHESITRQTYDGERFTFTFWLMGVQMLGNCAFAAIQHRCCGGAQTKDLTPTKYYILSAIFFCGAVFGSNHALQYISYPSQVVGKACKPIPILIITGFVTRKRHNVSKYVSVFVLVIGVTVFLYSPDLQLDAASKESEQSAWGHVLLLTSLFCDGFCGGVQERMRTIFKPTVAQMMLWTNFWSLVLIAPLVLVTKQLEGACRFLLAHPEIIPRFGAFCTMSALGQYFIFLTIKHFGPLTVSIFTTCRKFFTILCSVFVFGNVLSQQQWAGALIVFTGLTMDAYFNF